jgi:uncharacterized protein YndB with AHSA1/START domain
MTKPDQPTVIQTMLVRVPAERAFQAFVDPRVTTRFWFSHSDGPLEQGRTLKWEWRPYGCSCQVEVKTLEQNKRIVIIWGNANERSTVEWLFDARPENSTLITVRNSEFTGAADPVAVAIDAMGGFSLVLANAKAFLEHGLELNLIYDKCPDAIAKSAT